MVAVARQVLSVASRPRFGRGSRARTLQLGMNQLKGVQPGRDQLYRTEQGGYSVDRVSLYL
jgi:hypothetical protein